ncbi:MAG TPA: tRNA-(ms[2]io[6]A)-hydroxylase [Myxococcales bacterium]|nr:tRNA-(ms[2]io[6]A)-hydroxylase [Myxococcales bacterium]HAN32347.1 tRNA-(ms[2]io[6]A)-hydroxylase [Myxococcales bacterium]|tara:strand:+ start:460 stop:1035 length:576 start_codon:yes stop_codon:yes gene_type:complete
MVRLRYKTPEDWTSAVMGDLDSFLQDHAHAERKVATSALTLAAQQSQKPELVESMIELAQEELTHFRQVHDLLRDRGQTIGQDRPDRYMGSLFKLLRKSDVNEYLLDRLLLFGIVEARGWERFRMISLAMSKGPVRDFYRELTRCEARHHLLFIRLAKRYFAEEVLKARLDELLDREAEIVSNLPFRAALH